MLKSFLSRKLLSRSISISTYNNQSAPKLPDCDFVPEKYSGPSYEKIKEIRSNKLSKSKRTIYSKPILFHQGYRQWLWDHSGTRYLDLFGGIATVGVGHCHPVVVNKLTKQANKLWHTSNLYMNPTIHEYAEELTATMPDNLKVCFFTNSGSESNDLAMVMSRLYTGAFDIISLKNSYHGSSPYTIGLTSHGTWKHNYANGFGIHHIMNPDPYKGIWGGSKCRDSVIQTDRTCSCVEDECMACDKYLEQLEETLVHSCPKKIAAFFIEGIQGVGGVVQFPKNYVKKAYEMVRSKGGLCISDEVQAGFGRLGTHMWGFQSHGVVPDIVTMAKSIGNGMAMSAVVTTQEIADKFADEALHLNTYSGNPLSTSAASGVLQVIKEENLMQNCDVVGTRLLKKLDSMRRKYSIVGDVRGKGLMVGMEMVESKQSRAPLNGESMSYMHERMKEMGLLVGRGSLYGNTFRIKPPMCVTNEDIDFACDVIEIAIKEIETQL